MRRFSLSSRTQQYYQLFYYMTDRTDILNSMVLNLALSSDCFIFHSVLSSPFEV